MFGVGAENEILPPRPPGSQLVTVGFNFKLRIRFCHFVFRPSWGFRGPEPALAHPFITFRQVLLFQGNCHALEGT